MSTTFQIIKEGGSKPRIRLALSMLICRLGRVYIYSRRELKFEVAIDKAYAVLQGQSEGKSDRRISLNNNSVRSSPSQVQLSMLYTLALLRNGSYAMMLLNRSASGSRT